MRVFKYRGGDKKTIERDLKLIEKNSFWGSNFSQLNDPCETLISLDEFKSLTTSFVKLLGGSSGQNLVRLHEALGNVISRSKEVGIYSLSQTYSDELLWAHYGNSHKGFCIEYDLELLLECYPTDKVYSFPVTYSKHPPEVNVADLSDKEGISIIKKLTGNKSLKWKYEKEHRIIIDRSGEYIYNHHALKAIYFGLRMDDLMKERMMTRLKGRGIDYYQIAQVEGKYQFERKKVPDKNGNEITYLCQVPKSKKRKQEVHYNIIEKDFNKFNGKATITIQLGSKLDSNELTWLANTIKDHVFWKADMIFISFILEGMTIGDGYWAVANFRGENLDVSINGLTGRNCLKGASKYRVK